MRIDFQWRGGDKEKLQSIFVDTEVKMKRLRGKDGLFERFLKVIPGFIRKNFNTLGSRLGFAWKPLTPSYSRWKNLNYPGNPILVCSGHMRMAATIPNAPGNFIQWLGNTMIYGLDKTKFKGGYPRAHQFGATIPAMTIIPIKAKALHFWIGDKEVFAKSAKLPARHIPPRPFMGLAEEDLKEMAVITADYFKRPK